MPAQPWKWYTRAKHHLGAGVIDLDATTFDLHLFQSSANFADAALSALGQLSSEVASGNGYTRSGKLMVVTWTQGASAAVFTFALASSVVWSAVGGNIPPRSAGRPLLTAHGRPS